jgi:ketosteroid isomerase-like protein
VSNDPDSKPNSNSKPDPNSKPVQPADNPAGNQEIEDFFRRLPANFRWPKPNAEAVAAAVEAIQRISGDSSAPRQASGDDDDVPSNCQSCGGLLPAAARFCVWCGQARAGLSAQQQHVHHHFHHHLGSQNPGSQAGSQQGSQPFSAGQPSTSPPAEKDSATPQGRIPVAGRAGQEGRPEGRAEIAARKVAQDWVQACNTRHIDDLTELYATDATLIRPNVPPVRSLPAIREFLSSVLEAGLGEVELESLRLDIMGEIAMDIGRCKMLVPVVMGKRREERGKYLTVMVRQPAGTWKILADCWSLDASLRDSPVRDSQNPPSESAPRKGSELGRSEPGPSSTKRK